MLKHTIFYTGKVVLVAIHEGKNLYVNKLNSQRP